MTVEDELGLDPGRFVAVVLKLSIASRPHAERGGAGDVGAAQVADVQRLAGRRVQCLQGRLEYLRRRLVVADLVGEPPARKAPEQALAVEQGAQGLAAAEAGVADDPEPQAASGERLEAPADPRRQLERRSLERPQESRRDDRPLVLVQPEPVDEHARGLARMEVGAGRPGALPAQPHLFERRREPPGFDLRAAFLAGSGDRLSPRGLHRAVWHMGDRVPEVEGDGDERHRRRTIAQAGSGYIYGMAEAAGVAVVTGASSGIGEATARALAAGGHRLALLARRTDRLEGLAEELGGDTLAIEADVTDRDSIFAAAERVKAELGPADVLVNNAGVMLLGPFSSELAEDYRRMVETNLLGAIATTEAFLDQLLDGGGDLVNISSVAGRTARPGNAVYAATKWGINGWSEALRQELQPDVRVIVIEPGAIATELAEHITHEETKRAVKDWAGDIAIPPEDIADVIAFAVSRPRRMVLNEILVRPTAQSR